MSKATEFHERFERFDDDFSLLQMSYQLQDDNGEPAAWIARVGVQTKTNGPSDPVKHVYPRGFQHFKTENDANAVALWGGLEWLEEGRPPLKGLDGSTDPQVD